MFSRSTNCGADLERADRAEHRVAAGAEPADRRQPGRRRRLRLVAPLHVPDAGRRRDDREVDQRRRDVQQAGARLRASARSIRARRATSFRTNGFQTMAIDATGRVYLAWPDRGYAAVRTDPATGDSRIVISTSTTGSTWTVPRAIQPDGVGHQLMPAMTFHGGKLRVLYYDLREDVSQLFGPDIDEAADSHRPDAAHPPHHGRVRGAGRARAARRRSPPRGSPSTRSGFLPGSTVEQRLQFNPPEPAAVPAGHGAVHGRLHRPGAVAAVRAERQRHVVVQHRRRTAAPSRTRSGPTTATCGRPADGNWANYTPVTSPAVGTQSRFDPTQQVPVVRARPGRDAQPEHLHGARHRRPVRVGAGQQQAVQRLSARLRRRRRECVRGCRAPTGCASRTSRPAARRRSCSSARR